MNQRTKTKAPAARPKSQQSPSNFSAWMLLAVTVATVGAVGYYYREDFGFGPDPRAAKKESDPNDPTPPKINASTPPGTAPEGMVWIPGGDFWMGTEEPWGVRNDLIDTIPVHKVYVDGFWMDKTEITNEQFAKFVAATKYVTVAEQVPDAKEFPDVDPSKLKPFSLVFKKPKSADPDDIDLSNHAQWWDVCYGASWKHPEGPGSTVEKKGNFPVVHVCWEDAVAYCQWAGKRLPTEAEWEFASRGGLDRKRFLWGDEKEVDGKCLANYWQGKFPMENTAKDGFEGVAPVGQYPPNGYGLYDMSGNVWEWCSDYYQPRYYLESPYKNPRGPSSGFDPNEPGTPKRVQRGGSFMCADNYCVRYVGGTRGKGEPRSAFLHVGFRCVVEAKKR